MIETRLSVLSATAVMLLNSAVAVAGPNQASADYIMHGCRDAASLITFSDIAESKEEVARTNFIQGSSSASASWVSLTASVCRLAQLFSKSLASSFRHRWTTRDD